MRRLLTAALSTANERGASLNLYMHNITGYVADAPSLWLNIRFVWTGCLWTNCFRHQNADRIRQVIAGQVRRIFAYD
jgi:hypothetical protein